MTLGKLSAEQRLVPAQLVASPEVPPMPMRETQAPEDTISLLHALLLLARITLLKGNFIL